MVVVRFKASQPYTSSASGRSTGFYTTMYMVGDEAVVTSVSGNYLGLDAKKSPPEAGQHKQSVHLIEEIPHDMYRLATIIF